MKSLHITISRVIFAVLKVCINDAYLNNLDNVQHVNISTFKSQGYNQRDK